MPRTRGGPATAPDQRPPASPCRPRWPGSPCASAGGPVGPDATAATARAEPGRRLACMPFSGDSRGPAPACMDLPAPGSVQHLSWPAGSKQAGAAWTVSGRMRERCCFLTLLCGRLNLQGCSFASAALGVCARARTRLVAGPVSLSDSCMISKLFGGGAVSWKPAHMCLPVTWLRVTWHLPWRLAGREAVGRVCRLL